MKIKTYYGDCRKETEGICFTEDSMTQQHFKDECDIDKILRKYETTGFLVDPLSPRRQAQFGDFSEVSDFQAAQNKIAQISEYFDSLPAAIRLRFGNRISEFLAFVTDDANRKACEELGIFLPEGSQESSPQETPPTSVQTSGGAPAPSVDTPPAAASPQAS